jgi:hypothetical protein
MNIAILECLPKMLLLLGTSLNFFVFFLVTPSLLDKKILQSIERALKERAYKYDFFLLDYKKWQKLKIEDQDILTRWQRPFFLLEFVIEGIPIIGFFAIISAPFFLLKDTLLGVCVKQYMANIELYFLSSDMLIYKIVLFILILLMLPFLITLLIMGIFTIQKIINGSHRFIQNTITLMLNNTIKRIMLITGAIVYLLGQLIIFIGIVLS